MRASFCEGYDERSLEEIRWADYCAGRLLPKTESERIEELLEEQGWALRQVREEDRTMTILKAMLEVSDASCLGKGRDVREYPWAYHALSVVYAWQVIAPERRETFWRQKATLTKDRARVEKSGHAIAEVASRLNAVADNLQEPLQANEGWYLHGTKPEHVLPILSGGLNERMCSGLFGKGVYLSEDPEKADQYATPDPNYFAEGLEGLHELLFRFGSPTRHPGEDLFFVFVVRAAAGVPMRTRDGAHDMDRQCGDVFASSDKRELIEVPKVMPPLRFHSLVVELGVKVYRFREFVHFNSARFNVEYLVVYRRVKTGKRRGD